MYVAFQALCGVAALYLSSPALLQNKTPVAPPGWRNVPPLGQATNYSYAVSADAPGLIQSDSVAASLDASAELVFRRA
jgi:hypothetical protein